MRGIKVICKQHEERKIREILEGFPELTHTVVQKAKKYGNEIPLKLVFLYTKKEPYFDQNVNAIVVGY